MSKYLCIYSLEHSTAFIQSRVRTASFPTTRNRKHCSEEAVDVLTIKLSRTCFIYYLHYVLCLVQKASLHIKEEMIRHLYQVENHLLNIPDRLKIREKSIRFFLFKQRGAKKLISAISQRHALLETRKTFAKANPSVLHSSSSKLK